MAHTARIFGSDYYMLTTDKGCFNAYDIQRMFENMFDTEITVTYKNSFIGVFESGDKKVTVEVTDVPLLSEEEHFDLPPYYVTGVEITEDGDESYLYGFFDETDEDANNEHMTNILTHVNNTLTS